MPEEFNIPSARKEEEIEEDEEVERRLAPEQRKGLSKDLIKLADDLVSQINKLEAQLKITHDDDLEEELESLKEQYDALRIDLDETAGEKQERIH